MIAHKAQINHLAVCAISGIQHVVASTDNHNLLTFHEIKDGQFQLKKTKKLVYPPSSIAFLSTKHKNDTPGWTCVVVFSNGDVCYLLALEPTKCTKRC